MNVPFCQQYTCSDGALEVGYKDEVTGMEYTYVFRRQKKENSQAKEQSIVMLDRGGPENRFLLGVDHCVCPFFSAKPEEINEIMGVYVRLPRAKGRELTTVFAEAKERSYKGDGDTGKLDG